MHLDSKANFKVHAESVTKRADESINSIRRIELNTGGPKQRARRLLVTVPHVVLLFSALLWAKKMPPGGWCIMEKCQRSILLRVAATYTRTTYEALRVLSGIPPIDLLAQERADMEEGHKRGRDREGLG